MIEILYNKYIGGKQTIFELRTSSIIMGLPTSINVIIFQNKKDEKKRVYMCEFTERCRMRETEKKSHK